MANKTYTVKKGDTLSAIARANDTTVNNLVKLNNIKDPDYIVVGQVLIISGTASTPKTSKGNMAAIDQFGLQSNTDRTVYATWAWDKSNTEHYEVKWMYATGDGVGFIGDKSTTDEKQSTYSAPENATHVAFYVKPISKTYERNDQEVSYWTADWSTRVAYYFSDNPPSTPPVPSVTIEDYQLTAKLENLDVNADTIQFQVVKDDDSVFSRGNATIKTDAASYSCSVDGGSEYKVRARAIRDGLYSEWSDYSNNEKTAPATPAQILELRALSETSVYLDWNKVSTATSYEIEYASKKSRFDSSTETQKVTVESVISHAEISGLQSGEEWFFRVRAKNDKGDSGWTPIKSVKIGTKPAAPTTWSSTTTAVTGDPLTLYWVHNSEDGSSQTYAELEISHWGITDVISVKNTTDKEEKDKTSKYVIDTTEYPEGAKIEWRVRTRGILADYSDWSIQRTVDIYAPPTLELKLTDQNGSLIDTLTSLPARISAKAGPASQTPIGYHVAIFSNEVYETIDSVGSRITVNKNEEVYSKHFDISDPLLVELSASDVSLENNISYTLKCTVSMDSGLTKDGSYIFDVAWEESEYWPNAEIGYDKETYTTSVRPYCENDFGAPIGGLLLSLYRREFDGSLTELAKDLDSLANTFVTDPHPSLDYARYRVVAKSETTGKVSYYDVPGYPVGEKAVIIQWNEAWSNFDTNEDAELEQPTWAGSLLRLPYNIDVSDSNDVDVELVEYIGRKHPVSYYGTQLGVSSTWNMDVDKKDKETLYALRRLAIWMGDVYVREPSGSGYWAKVSVSFSQKHCELVIPVTLSIVRVAGGV